MAYPEPSINDHNAPWNEIEIEDPETGETAVICGCSKCERERNEEARIERLIDSMY